MIVRHINGTHPLNRLRGEMEQLFGGIFDELPIFGAAGSQGVPPLNVWEDADNLYAEAEVPGLPIEDIEILVLGDELSIKGERKAVSQEGLSYHHRERGVGTFSRVVRLPVDIDADKVEAVLRDGVLLVTLPKSAASRPRKIEVKAP